MAHKPITNLDLQKKSFRKKVYLKLADHFLRPGAYMDKLGFCSAIKQHFKLDVYESFEFGDYRFKTFFPELYAFKPTHEKITTWLPVTYYQNDDVRCLMALFAAEFCNNPI